SFMLITPLSPFSSFSHSSLPRRDLHSFPTRRSSDLVGDITRPRLAALQLLEVTAFGQDDGTLVEERVRYRDGLIQQSARIVAQVDDVALELLSGLLLQLLHRLDQIGVRLLVEGRNFDVRDLIVRLEP